jgi:hypothetical protein
MNDIVACISGWVFGQSWMTYKWYAHDHWIWVAVWIKIRSLKNWDAYKYQPIGPQMTLVCSFSWSSSCYISSHNLNERNKQPLWYPHLCLSHSQISQLALNITISSRKTPRDSTGIPGIPRVALSPRTKKLRERVTVLNAFCSWSHSAPYQVRPGPDWMIVGW